MSKLVCKTSGTNLNWAFSNDTLFLLQPMADMQSVLYWQDEHIASASLNSDPKQGSGRGCGFNSISNIQNNE